MYRHHVATARARIAQSVEDGYARTHEGTRLFGGNLIRNRGECGRGCNHVLGISTIEIETGDFAIDTHREISAAALLADEIMAAVPTDTDALPHSPCCDLVAKYLDASRNFVAGNARILKTGPKSLLDQRIAMTDPARFNLDQDFAGVWLRDFAFNQFPISVSLADLRCFHFAHGSSVVRTNFCSIH